LGGGGSQAKRQTKQTFLFSEQKEGFLKKKKKVTDRFLKEGGKKTAKKKTRQSAFAKDGEATRVKKNMGS